MAQQTRSTARVCTRRSRTTLPCFRRVRCVSKSKRHSGVNKGPCTLLHQAPLCARAYGEILLVNKLVPECDSGQYWIGRPDRQVCLISRVAEIGSILCLFFFLAHVLGLEHRSKFRRNKTNKTNISARTLLKHSPRTGYSFKTETRPSTRTHNLFDEAKHTHTSTHQSLKFGRRRFRLVQTVMHSTKLNTSFV